jgi:serine/threonine protein phosphatase PrpC
MDKTMQGIAPFENLVSSISLGVASDIGRVRDANEDSIGYDLENRLVVLADGMGGCNAGEVASALAVNVILREFRQLPLGLDDRENFFQVGPDAIRLCTAISKANGEIFQSGMDNPEYEGMGTTVVAVLVKPERAIIASIGDSRVYLLRNRRMEQLTVDHTLLQEHLDSGLISEAEAQHYAGGGLITRALGVDETVKIDVQEQPTAAGDTFLLCSDGLFDMLANEEIYHALMGELDLNFAAKRLVQLANEKGGYDNISVALIRIDR